MEHVQFGVGVENSVKIKSLKIAKFYGFFHLSDIFCTIKIVNAMKMSTYGK